MDRSLGLSALSRLGSQSRGLSRSRLGDATASQDYRNRNGSECKQFYSYLRRRVGYSVQKNTQQRCPPYIFVNRLLCNGGDKPLPHFLVRNSASSFSSGIFEHVSRFDAMVVRYNWVQLNRENQQHWVSLNIFIKNYSKIVCLDHHTVRDLENCKSNHALIK